MEYITTDKNIIFKDGLIIRKYSNCINWHIEGSFSAIEFTEQEISALLDLDLIKEVEENEFTKSDMKDLVKFWIFNGDEFQPTGPQFDKEIEENFNKWKDEKNK